MTKQSVVPVFTVSIGRGSSTIHYICQVMKYVQGIGRILIIKPYKVNIKVMVISTIFAKEKNCRSVQGEIFNIS